MTDLTLHNSPDSVTRAVLVNRLPESHQEGQFNSSLAVVIGIDGYNQYPYGIPRLQTPVGDAQRMAEVLEQQQEYQVLEPLTEDVTRARLVELFQETLPKLNLDASDRLLIYFAGHGTVIPDASGEPEYFLVPQDANPDVRDSFLPMRWVREELLKLKCRHLLLVLDCCFAGGFGRMRSFDEPPPKIYRERFNFYVRSPAWQVIASAAYDETALDTAGGYVFGRRAVGAEADHSPFASALFAALAGQADVNPAAQDGAPAGDGLITATELYGWVRDQVQALADARGYRQSPGLWPLPNHQAGEYVFRNPERALSLEDLAPLTDAMNPYRGLKSYDETQSHLFFGRTNQIAALAEKASQQPFIAVLGVSGTGKSSLAKAGLIPALGGSHGLGEPPDPRPVGEARWLVLPHFRPAADPVASLAKLLADHLPAYAGRAAALAADPDGLAAVLTAWAADHAGGRLVLVIDQFEELVTLCADEAQRKHFQRLLNNALAAAGDVLRVVITLRTDFEPQFTAGPLQGFWGQEARFVVLPMSQDDLRQVILGPAWASELYFVPHMLVDDLINEVIQAPGGLPLLSFALSEMFLHYVASGRSDRVLRREDFDAVGGVIGSLRASANKIWDSLDPSHQATMERLMLRMVAVEGGELARRRVALSELDYPTAAENARVQAVLDRLVDARLLVRGTADPATSLHSAQGAGEEQGAAYVEPAHDALVLAWDKLLRWKQEAQEVLPLQRRLAQAASEWRQAAPAAKAGLLWDDDPRLPQVEETLWPVGGKQRGPAGRMRWARQVLAPNTDAPADTQWLNGAELSFTQASVSRRSSTFRRIIGITAAVMIALVGLVVLAEIQRRNAVSQERRAKVGELSARSEANLIDDPELSILLANSALSLAKPKYALEAEAALREALQVSRIESSVALSVTDLVGTISADGLRFATADKQGRVSVRSTLTGEQLQELVSDESTEILGLTLSPQTSSLLALAFTDAVQIFDLNTQKQVFIARLEGRFVFADFSPDGTRLAIRSVDYPHTVVRVWDITQRRLIAQQTFATRGPLRFSADGRFLAVVVQPGKVSVWDSDLTTEINTWDVAEGAPATIWNLAISPNREMAVGDDYGYVRGWDISEIKSPRLLYSQKGHDDYVFRMAYSHNGECLVTTSNDQTTLVWDRRGNQLARLTGHKGLVIWAAFRQSDGVLAIPPRCGTQHLVSLSKDGTLRTWNADEVYQYRGLQAHAAPIEEIEFSPKGDHFATVGKDGQARLWRTSSLQLEKEWPHASPLDDVDFSSDGLSIATAVSNNTAEKDGSTAVWSTTAQPHKGLVLKGHEGRVFTATFRPHHTSELATGGADGKVILWDIGQTDGPVKLKQWPLTDQGIYSVEFSKDGRQIVTGALNGLSHLIDIESCRVITFDLGSRTNSVYQAVLHPEGLYLATAGNDGKIRLWQIASGKEGYQIGRDDDELGSHKGGAVSSLDFSSTGHLLVSGGVDGEVILWDVVRREKKAEWRGSVESINSVRFSPDDRVVAVADERGVVAFFLVDSHDLLEYARKNRVTRSFTTQECIGFELGAKCGQVESP